MLTGSERLDQLMHEQADLKAKEQEILARQHGDVFRPDKQAQAELIRNRVLQSYKRREIEDALAEEGGSKC